jgi:hypothetical protein
LLATEADSVLVGGERADDSPDLGSELASCAGAAIRERFRSRAEAQATDVRPSVDGGRPAERSGPGLRAADGRRDDPFLGD